MKETYFLNRQEAGERLVKELLLYKDQRPIVLALPRGGVPVGFEVAKALNAPLDLVLVRKIGAPGFPELAVGAVVDGPAAETVLNEELVRELNIPDAYLEQETKKQLEEIERRRRIYLADRPRADVKGRTAIIVDDGIATGATIRAAVLAVRKAMPARLVLAVPVAPPETIEQLRADVDDTVCLLTPPYFGAISAFYADFHQVADDEVTDLMRLSACPDQQEISGGYDKSAC